MGGGGGVSPQFLSFLSLFVLVLSNLKRRGNKKTKTLHQFDGSELNKKAIKFRNPHNIIISCIF